MFDTSLDNVMFATKPSDGQVELMTQLGEVGATQVAQLHPLEIVPNALIRIEIRRIARKGLDMYATRSAVGQELLDSFAFVDGSPVPDQKQLAGDVVQQVVKETDDILARVGSFLGMEEQFTIQGDGADSREVIPSQIGVQDGCFALGGIGAHNAGQGVESALVYPQDSSTFFLCPLFISGHRSVYHSSTASSSLWVARRIGFCTLQPIERNKREMWAG